MAGALEVYSGISYQVVGGLAESLADTFKDIKVDLRRAGIKISLVEYISAAIFSAIVAFVVSLSVAMVGIYSATGSLSLSLIMGLTGGIFTGAGAFFVFYIFPYLKIGKEKRRIDDMLPFATLYLATMAGSGSPPVAMFRTLAKFEEYGEIAEEAARITEEIDVMGLNIVDALKNAANRTPSDRFKEILWGIMTTMLVGGDLKAFLHEKAVTAMNDYRRRLQQFTSQLAMFMEMYITTVIVGSIFFIVLSTIMSAIGGAPALSVAIQLAVTFLFLPLASVAFLVLMKGIAPVA